LTINKIIWVGCIDFSKATERSSALSPAANAWQINFIKALSNNSNSIYVFSHIPYSAWPKGPFIVRGSKNLDQDGVITIKNLFYINLPFVRDIYLALYTVMLICVYAMDSKYLFTYNYSYKCVVSGLFWKLFGNKWVSIFADGFEKFFPYKTLYLSYHAYINSNNTNKIFFDSGIENYLDKVKKPVIKNILFAGSISSWTGIYEFVKDFCDTHNCFDFILDIYGKGDIAPIKHLIDGKRVRYFGYVDEEKLHAAALSAYAFINPRPGVTDTELNNFPSKISFYLGFGKPILSTRTANIAPFYDKYLIFYKSIEEIGDALDKYYNTTSRTNENTLFVELNSWDKKVSKLLKSQL